MRSSHGPVTSFGVVFLPCFHCSVAVDFSAIGRHGSPCQCQSSAHGTVMPLSCWGDPEGGPHLHGPEPSTWIRLSLQTVNQQLHSREELSEGSGFHDDMKQEAVRDLACVQDWDETLEETAPRCDWLPAAEYRGTSGRKGKCPRRWQSQSGWLPLK